MSVLPAGKHQITFINDQNPKKITTVGGFEAFFRNLVAKIFCQEPKFVKFTDGSKTYWLEKNSAINWINSYPDSPTGDIPSQIRQICAQRLSQGQGQTPPAPQPSPLSSQTPQTSPAPQPISTPASQPVVNPSKPIRTAQTQQISDVEPKSGIKFCWASIGHDGGDFDN